VADKGHEVLDVGSRQAAERGEGERSVLSDARLAELSEEGTAETHIEVSPPDPAMLDGQVRPGLTLMAAAAHLALATSCVLPWISGTDRVRHEKSARSGCEQQQQ
jgi:hypothetical protein